MVEVTHIQQALGFSSAEFAGTLAREGHILHFSAGDFVMEPS